MYRKLKKSDRVVWSGKTNAQGIPIVKIQPSISELDRLRAENLRLRAALEAAKSYIAGGDSSVCADRFNRLRDAVHKAEGS